MANITLTPTFRSKRYFSKPDSSIKNPLNWAWIIVLNILIIASLIISIFLFIDKVVYVVDEFKHGDQVHLPHCIFFRTTKTVTIMQILVASLCGVLLVYCLVIGAICKYKICRNYALVCHCRAIMTYSLISIFMCVFLITIFETTKKIKDYGGMGTRASTIPDICFLFLILMMYCYSLYESVSSLFHRRSTFTIHRRHTGYSGTVTNY